MLIPLNWPLHKPQIFLLLLFFTAYHSYAQTSFRKLNGGNNFDYGHSVIETPDAGICIAGSTNSFGSGNDDVYIIKLDSNFNQQWSKTFDWGLREYGLSITATRDGGYAVTGYAQKSILSDSVWDAFLLKLDASGNIIWSRSIGGLKEDDSYALIETKTGDLIIAGSTTSFGDGQHDIYINKYSSNGDLIWSKTLGTSREDIAYSITATHNGFAIAGAASGFKPFIAKCDMDGNVIWSEIVAADSLMTGAFTSVIQTADNGFALTGYTKTTNQDFDLWCVLITGSGKIKWCGTIGNAGDDKGYSIAQDSTGNFVIAGYVNYNRRGFAQNLYVVKISNTANPLWNKTITEQSEASGASVMIWKERAYIVAGSAWQTPDNILYKPDIYLAAFDTAGKICGYTSVENKMHMVKPYISILNFDTTTGDTDKTITVTSYNGGEFFNTCTGSFSMQENKIENKALAKLPAMEAVIMPNPVTNGILNLHVKNISGNTQFTITDMQGKVMLVKRLNLSAIPESVIINIAQLPAGIYILKINNAYAQQPFKFIKTE